jgi:AraC-like DNA-binding protein
MVAPHFDHRSDSITLDFLQAGTGSVDHDRLVDVKTVPFGILTQAIEGSYEVGFSGHTESGPTGTVMFAPPQIPLVFTHRTDRASGRMALRFVHFRFLLWGGLDLLELLRPPRTLPSPASAEIGEVIDALLKLPVEGRSRLATLARRQELGFHVLRILTDVSDVRPRADEALDDTEQIGWILREIGSRPGEDWTADGLARLGRMSRASLYRHFVAAVGLPPMEYLKRVRLDEGARRLLHGAATVRRIAGEVGFASAEHFAREFSRRFGVTPSVYRDDPLFSPNAAGGSRGRAAPRS